MVLGLIAAPHRKCKIRKPDSPSHPLIRNDLQQKRFDRTSSDAKRERTDFSSESVAQFQLLSVWVDQSNPSEVVLWLAVDTRMLAGKIGAPGYSLDTTPEYRYRHARLISSFLLSDYL